MLRLCRVIAGVRGVASTRSPQIPPPEIVVPPCCQLDPVGKERLRKDAVLRVQYRPTLLFGSWGCVGFAERLPKARVWVIDNGGRKLLCCCSCIHWVAIASPLIHAGVGGAPLFHEHVTGECAGMNRPYFTHAWSCE